MILPVVLCAALATTAFGNYAANRVMDDILMNMASETRNTGLDPTAVGSFQLKVKGNGLSNRDFKADFVQGSLIGLGQLRRQGDCSLGMFGGEMKMGCYVSLGSVRFLMNADVKGDSLGGKTHSVSTSTVVTSNSLVLIELQGYQNFQARLAGLTIRPVTMTTTVAQGKVDLNSGRFNEFIKIVNDSLAQRLALTLRGGYSSVLNRVANRFRMP